MGRFNTATVSPTKTPVANLAGGKSYQRTPKGELAATVLTSFVTDQYYRSASDTIARVRDLVVNIDPLFAAKLAIFARSTFQMRSISHVVAGEIALNVKGASWTKQFFDAIVDRPDDMLEILSYIQSVQGSLHPLPASLKKGFASALTRYDEYALGRYRGEGKTISMVDVVNLVHPPHTPAISKLINGKLRFEGWETDQTKIGQTDLSDEEKAEAVAGAWDERIPKMGYMALLRNLRNIRDKAPESLDAALARIRDKDEVARSRQLPFRFTTAISQFVQANNYGWGVTRGSIGEVQSPEDRKIVAALNEALDHSTANVPVLPGRTAVLLDLSGSMGNLSDPKGPLSIGSLFAAAVARKSGADIIAWADFSKNVSYNPGDSVATLREQIAGQSVGHGTNLSQAIDSLKGQYDRIIIFSDFQSWREGWSSGAPEALKRYKARTSADPKVYSFDLQGYGTLSFPEPNVYNLYGFSEKVFDIMEMLEQDQNAMTKAIEAVTF